jgi:hypothetical protein
MHQEEDRLVTPRFLGLICGAMLLLATLSTHSVLQASPDGQAAKAESTAVLEFSPPRLRYCGLPVERTRIRVAWDATAANVNRTRVYLHGTDGQLFASGGAVGESETGEWVTNGMKFVLYSPELDEVLAEKAFRLIPCDTKKYPDELPAEP